MLKGVKKIIVYNMKVPFYQLYSYWCIILVILKLLFSNVITFSIYPTIVFVFIGGISLLFIKYLRSKKVNYKLALWLIITHTVPLFLFDHKNITECDIQINIFLFLLYLISLELQNTNIIFVYFYRLKTQDPNNSISQYLFDLIK